MVAHAGFEHMLVTTGEWTVKDGIKLKVSASGTVEDITRLAEHGGGSAILVFADAQVFFGERAAAKADKDQPDLPIDENGVFQQETELKLNELNPTRDEGEEEAGEGDEGEQAEIAGGRPRRRRRTAAGDDAPPAPAMPADTTRTAVDA